MIHQWGEENFDWKGLDEAGWYIGRWLRTWTRLSVFDIKEKFGSLRIYCHFGWDCFYSIWRPSHCWISPWWPYRLDLAVSKYVMPIINILIIPLQKKAYVWRYKKAVEKWPHLRDEILSDADYGELFEGAIPDYKHSDYWSEPYA